MIKKFKMGVFGSAFTDNDSIKQKAQGLGKSIDKETTIVVTGACSGLPYIVASTAAERGVEVWGYSPTTNIQLQKAKYPNDDSSIYTKLIYIPENYEFANITGANLKYRNVSSTANCDAGIIISGRWGSLNEFTNLFDMGKVIGVLTGTGGIADELESLNKKIYKESKAVVLFDDNPKNLVEKVINELNLRNK